MKSKHVLLYPLFLRCCLYIVDPFWKYIFEDLAYNKTPYGIVVNEDGLHSIIKHKEFSVLFEGKSDQEIAFEVCKGLSEKLSILSQKDHIFRRNAYENAYDKVMKSITSWNDIKKKRIKDLLIEQYVLKMKADFKLSMPLTRILYSIVFIGLQFKTITAKHIIYIEGRITKISGIRFTSHQIHCDTSLMDY